MAAGSLSAADSCFAGIHRVGTRVVAGTLQVDSRAVVGSRLAGILAVAGILLVAVRFRMDTPLKVVQVD